jgi:hypothetical protein
MVVFLSIVVVRGSRRTEDRALSVRQIGGFEKGVFIHASLDGPRV